MKTVKFKGESVHSLMRQVKDEYGDNVLLLNTRQDTSEVVEIEVGVLDDTEYSTSEESVCDEDITLEDLANLYHDSDVLSALELHGVSQDLIKALRRTSRAKNWTNEVAAKAIGKVLSFDPYLPENVKYVGIFGPRGSGRTTSILKLAGKLTAALGLHVGIIAADPEDEKGAYHLVAMGKVLGVPVVGLEYDIPVELRINEAAERLGDCDLILVDAPALSFDGSPSRKEIVKLCGNDSHFVKVLVLPATASESELLTYIRSGVAVGCSRAMVSLLDKCGKVGSVVNALWRTAMPVSFLSAGESVPHDIEPASPRRLAWYLSRLVH